MSQSLTCSHVSRPMVVGVLRTLGKGGATQRVWVRCEHREDTVPAERCATCPRCTAMTFGPDGNAQAVHCRPVPAARANGAHELRLPRLSVADLMTRNVLCLRPDLPLEAAWGVLSNPEHSVMPVTSDEGLLLGLVHRSDLERRMQQPDAGCVADVLRHVDCAVLENVSGPQAAGIMLTEGCDRLIVVNPAGEVVGVLSSSTLLAWIARADGYVVPMSSGADLR